MKLPSLFALLSVLTLYSCSGGSESASTPQSTQPPPDPNLTVPLRTAIANIVQDGFNQTFTISGSVDNSTPSNPVLPTPITGNGRLVQGPATPATLCTFTVASATQVITGTTVANGASTPLSSIGAIYYRNDNAVVATRADGELFLFTPYTYPETIKAGETGQIGAGTQVNLDCTQTLFASTITGTYVATADSANSLLVTFVSVRTNFSGSSDQTSTVYRINTVGEVSLVSITAARSALGSVFQTITFTF